MHLRNALVALCILAPAGFVGCGGGDASPDGAPAEEASEPSASGGDADLAELQDYELSMDALHRWRDANIALQRLAEENPELAAEMETDADVGDGDRWLDSIEESVESVPQARAAIEDAGLSAREYGLITLAMFQAGMAQFAIEQGGTIDEVARDMQVNPDNIRFMQEHRAEIEQMTAELEAAESGR